MFPGPYFQQGRTCGRDHFTPRSLLSESLGEGILDGKARRKNSILATGMPIRVQFDKPRSMPGSDIIHTWAVFDGSYINALTYLSERRRGDHLLLE